MTFENLVSVLSEDQVEICVEKGQLKVRSKSGPLRLELIESIKFHRESLLEKFADSEVDRENKPDIRRDYDLDEEDFENLHEVFNMLFFLRSKLV